MYDPSLVLHLLSLTQKKKGLLLHSSLTAAPFSPLFFLSRPDPVLPLTADALARQLRVSVSGGGQVILFR